MAKARKSCNNGKRSKSGRRSKSKRSRSRKRSCRRKRRVGPPRRAPNAFILFYVDFLKKKKKQEKCPNLYDTAREAGKCWKKLSKQQKAAYKKKYCAKLAKVQKRNEARDRRGKKC